MISSNNPNADSLSETFEPQASGGRGGQTSLNLRKFLGVSALTVMTALGLPNAFKAPANAQPLIEASEYSGKAADVEGKPASLGPAQTTESAEAYKRRMDGVMDDWVHGRSTAAEPRRGGTLREEQRQGYTYIRMDQPETDSTGGHHGVTEEALRNQIAGRLVIMNYSYEGLGADSASGKQAAFLNRALPLLAKRSRRPLVFIDAVAVNQSGPVYMANLLGEQEKNKLGRNDATVNFNYGKYMLPYGIVLLDGERIYDFSFSVFDKEVKETDIQNNTLLNLATAVKISNNQLVASNQE